VFVERATCELCGRRDTQVLYAEGFAEGETFRFIANYYANRIPKRVLERGRYVLRRCPSCGFVWQGEVLDDDNLERLYSHWIDGKASAQKYAKREPSELAGLIHDISAVCYLVKTQAARIMALDFGAGWGRWCQIANAIGVEAWGAELSEERIAHMRSLGIPICADIFAETQCFEFINAEQVFEHLPHPRRYFDQLASLLAPGGIMRISVPDGSGFEKQLSAGTWRPQKDAVHPLEHVNCYTPASLRTLSRGRDMRVVTSGKVCHAYFRCLVRGSGSLKTLKNAAASLGAGVVFFQKQLTR
jgi:2-polyprenyl-3-methyl-5-hydroxy-6-metoxy-1,4-benzoquinol methylase